MEQTNSYRQNITMDVAVEGSVLLLGEGDFSFSLAFRKKLPTSDITSSCLLSKEQLFESHKAAKENISLLEKLGR